MVNGQDSLGLHGMWSWKSWAWKDSSLGTAGLPMGSPWDSQSLSSPGLGGSPLWSCAALASPRKAYRNSRAGRLQQQLGCRQQPDQQPYSALTCSKTSRPALGDRNVALKVSELSHGANFSIRPAAYWMVLSLYKWGPVPHLNHLPIIEA